VWFVVEFVKMEVGVVVVDVPVVMVVEVVEGQCRFSPYSRKSKTYI